MRRMGSEMLTCQMCDGRISRGRRNGPGSVPTALISEATNPNHLGHCYPRTRFWYLLTHARTRLGHNAERMQSVARRCEVLLLY